MIEFLQRRWHRLRQIRLPEIEPLNPITLEERDPRVEAVLATRPFLEKVLKENIIPFWIEECVDWEDGGYRLNHDPAGRWKGPSDKATIPQARMCWFFSRAARGGYLPEGLSAAEHGFEFLRDRLWDAEHGGFFWSVTHDGASVVDDSKRLYSASFAAFGLTEYARAGGDPEAMAFARESVEMLRDRFHDPVFGGFHSEFGRAWDPPDPEKTRGEVVFQKTVNEHRHVLEAFAAHFELSPEPWIKQQVVELILILTSTALRKTAGTSSDRHRADWTPLLGRDHAHVSYGHDMESAWLVPEACKVVGIPLPLVLDWCRSLGDLTLRWGRDRRRGGVYFAGPIGGPAHSRTKVWWAQAEVLVGALALYRLTGEARYADLYLETLDWIGTKQVDWSGGDWHAFVRPNGAVEGDKAGLWKSPYHNGRAMMQCLELLTPGNLLLT